MKMMTTNGDENQGGPEFGEGVSAFIRDRIVTKTPVPVKYLVDSFSKSFPDLWKEFCPRVYNGTDEFYDYRLPCLQKIGTAVSAVTDAESVAQDTVATLTARIYIPTQKQYGYPMFFLKKELLTALVRTELKDPVDWAAMRFPYPSFSIMMPKESLFTDGEPVTFIECAKVLKGQLIVLSDGLAHPAETDMFFLTATLESGVILYNKAVAPYDPFRGAVIGQDPNAPRDYEISIDDADLVTLDDVTRIFFNCLYVMAARPEYIEMGERVGAAKKTGKEFWTPNIIGRSYVTQRDPDAEPGTHASPRMHWRRGHFRRQAIGPGRAEHKMLWIEPVLVNAKSVE